MVTLIHRYFVWSLSPQLLENIIYNERTYMNETTGKFQFFKSPDLVTAGFSNVVELRKKAADLAKFDQQMRDRIIITLEESEDNRKQEIWGVFNQKYMSLVGVIF